MSRAVIIRKCLEAYRDGAFELKELQKQYEYYQYLRQNVRGISYEPRVPNASAPSGESKALMYDDTVTEIASKMYMLQMVKDYIDSCISALDLDDESLIRERYIHGMNIDAIAIARDMNREQVKYRIEQIIRRM